MDPLLTALRDLHECGLLWPLVVQLAAIGLILAGTSKRVLGETTGVELTLCGFGLVGTGAFCFGWLFYAACRAGAHCAAMVEINCSGRNPLAYLVLALGGAAASISAFSAIAWKRRKGGGQSPAS